MVKFSTIEASVKAVTGAVHKYPVSPFGHKTGLYFPAHFDVSRWFDLFNKMWTALMCVTSGLKFRKWYGTCQNPFLLPYWLWRVQRSWDGPPSAWDLEWLQCTECPNSYWTCSMNARKTKGPLHPWLIDLTCSIKPQAEINATIQSFLFLHSDGWALLGEIL